MVYQSKQTERRTLYTTRNIVRGRSLQENCTRTEQWSPLTKRIVHIFFLLSFLLFYIRNGENVKID